MSRDIQSSIQRGKKRNVLDKLRLRNKLVRECIAEFLGTFILMVFGNGAVAQTTLSHGNSGNFLTIYWGYGLGVTIAVYVAGGVSGAHINPAVSLANCVLGRLPWIKLPFYVFSQFLGAFVSAAVVFGIYYDALNAFDGGERQAFGPNGTAAIFATYPQDYLSIVSGFFDQVFGTALLLCGILAINDKRNNKPPTGLEPLLVGFLVFILGTSYGTNCGYAINPARDFGPRLFTYFAGWGSDVFTGPNDLHWWWVPIVAPLTGGVLGAIVYFLAIELHWHELEDTVDDNQELPKSISQSLRRAQRAEIESVNEDDSLIRDSHRL